MATGKAINLRVRPIYSVDLCYPVDGLICQQSETLLGESVSSFQLGLLYNYLSETVEGNSSRLRWDSGAIHSYLMQSSTSGPVLLSFVRNNNQAIDLDNAIRMRQNAYLTSYSPEVLEKVRKVYYDDPDDDWAIQYRLIMDLEKDMQRLNAGLNEAYEKRGLLGKVIADAISTYDNKATQYSGGGHVQFEGISETKSRGFEFRYPSAENDMRYRRARIGLRQEYLNAWRMAEMCRYGEVTFPNELATIDSQITKLQCAYIDTFLFSPYSGVVTGVFRQLGDYVRAGEPVIRVENDEAVYLVGTIKYRGILRVGSKVTVTTTLFDSPAGQPTKLSGSVAAVRGHESVDEQWDILVLCANRADEMDPESDPIVPLNYSFDFDSTTVEVTAV